MVRIAHCRFAQSPNSKKLVSVRKGEPYDKIVSSAWTFDTETSILTYGAVVYRKLGKTDFWNKKQHREKALERFNTAPVRIKLQYNSRIFSPSSVAIDYFIAEYLIFFYNCEKKESAVYNVPIYDDFNELYDPRESGESEENEENDGSSNTEDPFDVLCENFFYGFLIPVGLATVCATLVGTICNGGGCGL